MTSPQRSMKAVAYDRYGSPDNLRLVDLPVPTPPPGQVRVAVRAVSLNLSDWEFLVGSPAYARFGGLFRPSRHVLGSDVAGVVDAVGDGVTGFAPGDEVYADNMALMGGFAEYTLVKETALALKPAALSFAEAACLPQAAAIARQGTEGLTPGQRILINGAGGGSGTLAIQLARRLGAHVTGVDNAHKLEFMTSVGAHDVLDYRAADFTQLTPRFDRILDLVSHRSVFAHHRALAPGGRYLCAGGSVRALLRVLFVGGAMGLVTGRRQGVLAVRPGPDNFSPVAELCASGEVKVMIDRRYPLDEVPAALARLGKGEALGKLVIELP